MIIASLVTLASFLVGQVAAHGGVVSYQINGQTYPGWQAFNSPSGQRSIGRPYSSYNPILNAMDGTMSCNNNGQPSGGQLSATVKAGDKITARWGQWTHVEGPVMVYMARCPGSCSSANSNSLSWFKIDEAGLISGTLAKGHWGNSVIIKDLVWTSTIPAALADGEYLIRHELLALHQANTPQFYPECAQLIVTGGGGQTPSSEYLAKFPGAYSMSDPGVRVDIYSQNAPNIVTYQVPGPKVWKGNAAAPPPPPPVIVTPPPAAPTPTAAPPPLTTAPGPLQTQFGQCGGQGYSGPTQCVSPYTCKSTNQWYSQCV
ncbi:hypothetical protein FA15DRAFT_701531 [Coprinopsis marcescibilis]|uniref:AA9 family lytic polysaccharide monooxygenase n=1 Tax=Coprinopsis marcescibilis TaxID=230819 RepID=A0A5C3L570_COPMA|nr:hypothetical protein FA15DRAFT_701531 [Coprinopsis marcescibilis]